MQGSPELRRELAARIEATHNIYTITEPMNGLVMTSMRDGARKARFFLGEVFVTEARVQVEGVLGLGIIAGEDADAAYQLAVIDAACNAGVAETAGWDDELRAEAARIAVRHAAEQERVLETRVAFDTMDAD